MYLAPVLLAPGARDQAFLCQPVHQFDGAVVLDLEPFGEVGNTRLLVIRFALDGQQELMVLWFDSRLVGRCLAEAKETPDLIAKIGQRLVIGEFDALQVCHSRAEYDYIVLRY
jgi:hypothetical protein